MHGEDKVVMDRKEKTKELNSFCASVLTGKSSS